MDFMEKLKNKTVGYYLALGASVIALITTIMYLVFGISSATFDAWIFTCLLLAIVPGIVLFFYDGYVGDFFGIVTIALLTAALGMFLFDSVGDFADFIVKIQLFGNMNNAGFRMTIIVFTLIGIAASVVGCFLNRTKEAI